MTYKIQNHYVKPSQCDAEKSDGKPEEIQTVTEEFLCAECMIRYSDKETTQDSTF